MSSGVPRPVVVTGASGFIGRGLCRHLLSIGYPVRGVSRDPTGLEEGVEPHRLAGLGDRDALGGALAGAGAVIHLAGRAHVMREDPEEAERLYFEVNAAGTEAVLRAAEDAAVERFILASSVKAVGEDSGATGWDEGSEPAPADPYGRSKLEAERIMLERAERSGMQAVALRLPLVYGPGVKANMRTLFSAVQRGVPLPVGRVHNRRSFLFTGNLNAAVTRLLEVPAPGRGVYFLSDGEDVSTPELARRIGYALGRPARLVPLPIAAFRAMGVVLDALSRITPVPAGSARVQRLLGSLSVDATSFSKRYAFNPPYSMQEGLNETAEWFLSSGAGQTGER